MGDKKRRPEAFDLYDHSGIEAHLAKMAAKGWLLEKIGFVWTYRRIEPAAMTFFVCYYPKASVYDPRPTEGELDFQDLCRHAGWTLAASNAQMQVFYTDRPDPVPIETDPALEVETIHAAAKKSHVLSYALLLAAALMDLVLFAQDLLRDPFGTLADISKLNAGLIWLVLLGLCGTELGGYFRWYVRARRAAERGERLATHSHKRLQLGLLAVLLAGLVLSAGGGSSLYRRCLAAGMGVVLALILAIAGLRALLKQANVSKSVSRVAVPVAAFLLAGVLLSLAVRGVLRSTDGGAPDRAGPAVLTPADLPGGEAVEYDIEVWEDRSPLARQMSVWVLSQSPAPDAPSLNYSLYAAELPPLTGLCPWAEAGAGCIPCDGAPWGAEEALRLPDRASFWLRYPDRTVFLHLSWEPSPAQMAAAGAFFRTA